jgi:hypothetical protein
LSSRPPLRSIGLNRSNTGWENDPNEKDTIGTGGYF